MTKNFNDLETEKNARV
jgi:uncharacterized coiled-coil protein SlyX